MLRERLREAFERLGFFEFKEITSEEIPFDTRVIDQCAMNTCGQYGKNHACPPLAGTAEELKARALRYKHGFVLNRIVSLESLEDMEETTGALNTAVKALRKEFANDDVLILGAGPCKLCETCTAPEGKPCRFPGKTQYSMEGCGIDVVRLSIQQKMTYNAGNDRIGYFTLALFNE